MDHPYSTDSTRQRIGSNVFLIALHNGSIAGFADFRPLYGTEAKLAAIYVLPEMQRREIGSRLLAAGIGRFPVETRFVLRVERDNAPTQHFYEAHGFRRSGEYTEELLGQELHDVGMVLEPGS